MRPPEVLPKDASIAISNLVILGVPEEDSELRLFDPDQESDCTLFPSASKYAELWRSKAREFSMGSSFAGAKNPTGSAITFNDLDLIDISCQPTTFFIWDEGKGGLGKSIMIGLKTVYSNGREIARGLCAGPPSRTLKIAENGSERIIRMHLCESEIKGESVVDIASFLNNRYETIGSNVPKRGSAYLAELVPPRRGFWSVRGFWGAW